VTVKVNRPGASVRTRKGYYATRFAATNPGTTQEALLEAVRSTLEATGLEVTARAGKGNVKGTASVVIRRRPSPSR